MALNFRPTEPQSEPRRTVSMIKRLGERLSALADDVDEQRANARVQLRLAVTALVTDDEATAEPVEPKKSASASTAGPSARASTRTTAPAHASRLPGLGFSTRDVLALPEKLSERIREQIAERRSHTFPEPHVVNEFTAKERANSHFMKKGF